MKINARLTESTVSSDEFTFRLSEMENKMQKVLAEKETLAQENKVHFSLTF